jgi:hypothetical protein
MTTSLRLFRALLVCLAPAGKSVRDSGRHPSRSLGSFFRLTDPRRPANAEYEFESPSPARRTGLALLSLVTFALSPALAVEVPAAPSSKPTLPPPKDSSELDHKGTFHLLPKTFQKNPDLNITVITEMTKEGLTYKRATPEEPVYYGMHSEGMQNFGDGTPVRSPVPPEKIRGLIQASLSNNGYLAGKLPEHPPGLALVYEWGLYARIDPSADLEIADLIMRAKSKGEDFRVQVETELYNSPELRLEWLIYNRAERENVAGRALMVGGEKFAADLERVLAGTRAQTELARTNGNYFPDITFAPLRMFIASSSKAAFLFDQLSYDVYYMAVVAYDFTDYMHGKKRPLWITRMTVDAQGVSMAESLPALVVDAAPYFGREMSESATLVQTIRRGANVEVGPLKVIGVETNVPPREGNVPGDASKKAEK